MLRMLPYPWLVLFILIKNTQKTAYHAELPSAVRRGQIYIRNKPT